jgi:hypothetical protein
MSDEGIETVIERLAKAYTSAGLPPLQGPPAREAETALASIAAEIAPLRLPRQLETFWRRVDPRTVSLGPRPELCDPSAALECWAEFRDEFPGMTPRLLFPIGQQGEDYLFVELATTAGAAGAEAGTGRGGAVFAWRVDGSPFALHFPDLAAYLSLLCTMIELEEFDRHSGQGRSWIEFDPDGRWYDAQAVRLAGALPVPDHGSNRTIDPNIRHWPAHWLAADELISSRRPRGATTTVAALLRESGAGVEVRGTIRGRVVQLASSGAGAHAAVDDGTAVLVLWCPAAVRGPGPVIERTFEFDVVVPPAAHDLAAEHFDATKIAEATAVRSLD